MAVSHILWQYPVWAIECTVLKINKLNIHGIMDTSGRLMHQKDIKISASSKKTFKYE